MRRLYNWTQRDQIVPIADSAYPGLPHGMCTTHPEIIDPDLLAFIRN